MTVASHREDMRRHVRLAVNLGARRRTNEGFADERVVNLSTGGLALATQTLLPQGSLEQLLISSPDGSFEASLQAEVMRVHGTTEPGNFVAGMRFRVLDATATRQVEQLMLHALSLPSGKRTGPRLEVHHEVFWSSGGWSGAAAFELLNVSQSGALLKAPALPPPDALGLLSLRADGADELLAVPAQVVWRREERGAQLAGVRFAQDPAAALLVRRILQRLLFHHPRPASSASPGTRIGEYELGPLLFRGQALEIYRARHAGKDVALKRFCGSASEVTAWTERFLAAAQLAPTLNHHAGVVRVHAAIADAEECWLATELVETPSLEQRMIEEARENRRLPLEESSRIAREVLATLEDCHAYILDDEGKSLCVLHGDVRPSNVLIDADGRARLIGFGVPFELRPERLAWLPPEALESKPLTPASDVFQVGVLLYELATGVLPFRAESVRQLLAAIAEGAPDAAQLNPEVPLSLSTLLGQALAADPKQRPASAAAFAEALARIELETGPGDDDFEITEAPAPPVHKPTRIPADARVATPIEKPLGPGERVGRYEIVGKLTEGDVAELFIARSEDSPWPVVLKTILPSRSRNAEIVSQFMSEARLVSQIDHQNVVRITDIGFDRLSPFIAMEYFASRTLADVMAELEKARRPMPVELAAYITAEAPAGLEGAHTQRDETGKPLHIVHRDVCAKNILIAYHGSVKVADFGIAHAAGLQRLTAPGHVRGTAAWVAPEQANGGPLTPATDVWALGVNLYFMLSGQLPFRGDTEHDVLVQVTTAEPIGVRRLRPEVPAALAEVLPRALAKSPVDRYPSAADLREEAMVVVPDPEACADALSAMMDSLFPDGSDAERMRLQQLAPEDAMPADASSPLRRLMGWLRK